MDWVDYKTYKARKDKDYKPYRKDNNGFYCFGNKIDLNDIELKEIKKMTN